MGSEYQPVNYGARIVRIGYDEAPRVPWWRPIKRWRQARAQRRLGEALLAVHKDAQLRVSRRLEESIFRAQEEADHDD